MEKPTYEQVSAGKTGHAEVVQVTFDPDVISFEEILWIFFSTHYPTTLNRQGHDIGTQYRSIILYHSEEQKGTAEQVIEELTRKKTYDRLLVTQLEPFGEFYKAEDYHQEYFKHHRENPYCDLVIAPKVAKLRKLYLSKLKTVMAEKHNSETCS